MTNVKTIRNPYYPDGNTADGHRLHARVSPEDYWFLRNKFPVIVGLQDKIISTLWHKLCNELRSYEQSNGPLDQSFYVDSPELLILRDLLDGCTVGLDSRSSGPRDVTDGTSGVRQDLRSDAVVSTDPQEGTDHGSGQPRPEKETDKGQEQRRRSDGSAQPAKVTPEDALRAEVDEIFGMYGVEG